MKARTIWAGWLLPLLAAVFLLPADAVAPAALPFDDADLRRVDYHGWQDSLVLSNGIVEVVVVPAIGRVMDFRFVGEEDGPLWQNPALSGKAVDPLAKEWPNFGGDKVWPAPQGEWEQVTGREWPPPAGFDQAGFEGTVRRHTIVLASKPDPHYGIRVVRRIELEDNEPELEIRTTFEKVTGEPVTVSIWTITQLDHPDSVFAQAPVTEAMPQGYVKLTEAMPQDLEVRDGLVRLTRDPRVGTKIGTAGEKLVWMNEKYVVVVEADRDEDDEYPDQGSSIEVWTNPDPLAYIELEALSELEKMSVEEDESHEVEYRLLRRTIADPWEQARKAMKDD